MHCSLNFSLNRYLPLGLALALAVAFPARGMCDAIEINGICLQGNCSSVDSIGFGGSVTNTTTNNFTVNGDSFSISDAVDNSFLSGTGVQLNSVLTYIGSTPLTQTDVITVTMLQNFYYPGNNVNYNGMYSEDFPFTLPVDTFASGELFFDGQGVGLLGPYAGPATIDANHSANLTGLNGNTLTTQLTETFTFTPGAAPGSTIYAGVAPTPEPGSVMLLGTGLLGVVGLVRRRRA